MLEHLSQQQGTGDITLFFSNGFGRAADKWVAISAAHQFRRLPIAQQPRP